MSKCANCGTELGENQKFCFECGTPVPQTKKCPSCQMEVPLRMKFCSECGYNFNGIMGVNGQPLAMGDKNVVAGDVTGQKIVGSVIHNTTIKDDTKSVNVCAVCGIHMTNDTGHTCPKCGKIICGSHFDREYLCCMVCSKELKKQEEKRLTEIAAVRAAEEEARARQLATVKSAEETNRVRQFTSHSGSFTDPRDGQVYRTIKIGNQVWFAENFRYKCEGACVYNDDDKNIQKYGRVYKWDVAMKCAPSGWHLPSNEEWAQLQNYIKSNAKNVASALKSTNGWNGYGNGSDKYGFCALPAGYRSLSGDFKGFGDEARFCTSSVKWQGSSSYGRTLKYCGNDLIENENFKLEAYSIRFLKD